jgi:hypothetical protein
MRIRIISQASGFVSACGIQQAALRLSLRLMFFPVLWQVKKSAREKNGIKISLLFCNSNYYTYI